MGIEFLTIIYLLYVLTAFPTISEVLRKRLILRWQVPQQYGVVHVGVSKGSFEEERATLRENKPDDGDLPEDASNAIFKMKYTDRLHNQSYQVCGSFRLLGLLFWLIGGLSLLLALNFLIDNGCEEDYLKYNCDRLNGAYCLRVKDCLGSHPNTWFSWQ
jgi:hypothetical protein